MKRLLSRDGTQATIFLAAPPVGRSLPSAETERAELAGLLLKEPVAAIYAGGQPNIF